MDAIGYVHYKARAMAFVDEFIQSVTQRLRRLKDAIPLIKDFLMTLYRRNFHEELSPATANLLTSAMKTQGIIASDRPYIVQLKPGFVPSKPDGPETKDDLEARQVPVEGIFKAVASLGLPNEKLCLNICLALIAGFDAMHHYSYQKDLHLENEKNIIVALGTEGLRERTQQSVAQLVDLGVNATRDAMNLFSAKLKADLKKEEERVRKEAERQEALRLEKAMAEAKAAAEKAAAAKAAAEKLHRQDLATVGAAFANPRIFNPHTPLPQTLDTIMDALLAGGFADDPRIHLPKPQPAPMQPHLAGAEHAQPITAELNRSPMFEHIGQVEDRAQSLEEAFYVDFGDVIAQRAKEHPLELALDLMSLAPQGWLLKGGKLVYQGVKGARYIYNASRGANKVGNILEALTGGQPKDLNPHVFEPPQGANTLAAKPTNPNTPAPKAPSSSVGTKTPAAKEVPLAQHPEFSKIFDQKTLQAV